MKYAHRETDWLAARLQQLYDKHKGSSFNGRTGRWQCPNEGSTPSDSTNSTEEEAMPQRDARKSISDCG